MVELTHPPANELSTNQCSRSECSAIAHSCCPTCQYEYYCGKYCQELEWPAHKLICQSIKNLSRKLQPYNIARAVINEILQSKEKNNLNILQHLLTYAEEQFGKEKLETGSRFRDVKIIKSWNMPRLNMMTNEEKVSTYAINQIQINNDIVELEILYVILIQISCNLDASNYNCHSKSILYLERSMEILKFWFSVQDVDYTSINSERRPWLLDELCEVLESLIVSHGNIGEVDIAESYCILFLKYARSLEDETKFICKMFSALSKYAEIRHAQGNLTDAVKLAEEAYNLVAIAHNPVHPVVQKASGILISNMISAGKLVDAERFAEATYDYLRDVRNEINPLSEDVAKGAYNLADVIYRQRGDLTNAARLAKESLDIRLLHTGNDIQALMIGQVAAAKSSGLLANILTMQGELGIETQRLWVTTLNSCIKNEGPDSKNVANTYFSKGLFHLGLAGYHKHEQLKHIDPDKKRRHLINSKYCFTECLRIQALLNTKSHTNDKTELCLDAELYLDSVMYHMNLNSFDN
jgi:tetratricopeptide (TPR) repeat protein